MDQKPIFSKQQEQEIVCHAIFMAKASYGFNPTQLRCFAHEFPIKTESQIAIQKKNVKLGKISYLGFLNKFFCKYQKTWTYKL